MPPNKRQPPVVIMQPRYALMYEIAKMQRDKEKAEKEAERLKPIAERWRTQLGSAEYQVWQIDQQIKGFKEGLEVLLKHDPLRPEIVEAWAKDIAERLAAEE